MHLCVHRLCICHVHVSVHMCGVRVYVYLCEGVHLCAVCVYSACGHSYMCPWVCWHVCICVQVCMRYGVVSVHRPMCACVHLCTHVHACVGTCTVACRMAARIAIQGLGEEGGPRHPLSGPPSWMSYQEPRPVVWCSPTLPRLRLSPNQGHIAPSVLPGSTSRCPRAACSLLSVPWGQESPPCCLPSSGSCPRWRGP